MTKEVFVLIEGCQSDAPEEPVVTRAQGTYHLHKEMHYISYEELPAEGEGLIKSRIKIAPTLVVITRTGAASADMSFELGRNTEAVYRTPYGELRFEVNTSRIVIKELPELLEIHLEYALYSDGVCASRNQTMIRIAPRIS